MGSKVKITREKEMINSTGNVRKVKESKGNGEQKRGDNDRKGNDKQ